MSDGQRAERRRLSSKFGEVLSETMDFQPISEDELRKCEEELPCFVVPARKLKVGNGAISDALRQGFDDTDVLVLFRVVDICNVLKRDYNEVYRELTRHFVVPVIPLHLSHLRRYWFAIACDGLRRFFEAHKRSDLAYYVNKCQGSLQHAYIEVSDLSEDDRLVSLLACLGSVYKFVEAYLKLLSEYYAEPERFDGLNELLIRKNFVYFCQNRWEGFWSGGEPSDEDLKFERMLALFFAIFHKTENLKGFRKFGQFLFAKVRALRLACGKFDFDRILGLFENKLDYLMKIVSGNYLPNCVETSSLLANLHACLVVNEEDRRYEKGYVCSKVQKLLDDYGNRFWTNRLAWHKFFSAASNEVKLALERFASDRILDYQLANAHFLAALDAARRVACRIHRRLFVLHKDKKRKFKYLPKSEEPQKALSRSLERAQAVIAEAVESVLQKYGVADNASCWNIAVRLGEIHTIKVPREAIKSVEEFLTKRTKAHFVNKVQKFTQIRVFISEFIERFGLRGLVGILNCSVNSFFRHLDSFESRVVSALITRRWKDTSLNTSLQSPPQTILDPLFLQSPPQAILDPLFI